MHIDEIRMDSIHDRYRRLSRCLPTRLRWLAYVMAPAHLSITTGIAGLLSLTGAVSITIAVGNITPDGASHNVAVVLVLALVAHSLGHLVKERQETLLTVVVRQITYRRFRDIFAASAPTPEARGHVLTYPGQISQFAFSVDFLLSLIQIVTFLIVSLAIYGANAAIAALAITMLAYTSIRLVHHIGRLWEQYIGLEGKRRQLLQQVCDSLPRGQYSPSWADTINAVHAIRGNEEQLLRRRVLLQTVNGFLERGALTTMLAVAAVLAVLNWPTSSFGIGIILSARYLYSAVQNNIVNYRVIRLAVPMMRELDRLESASRPCGDSEQPPSPCRDAVEIVTSRQACVDTITEVASQPTAGYVPQNPELSAAMLSAWRDHARPGQLLKFTRYAGNMGLNDAVIERLWRDPTTLSSGERHRAAVALVLADDPDWLVLDDTFSALDAPLRERVAVEVMHNVASCTLLARSPEYTPSAMQGNKPALSDTAPAVAVASALVNNGSVDSVERADVDLPEPISKRATFARSAKLLFGPQCAWIALGAVSLAGAEVVFAVSLGGAEGLTHQFAWLSAGCAVLALLGTLAFYWPQYRAPIKRLTQLHHRLIHNLPAYASAKHSGPTVARLGEDFSDLQMSVPGALGASILVTVQSMLLVGGAVAGAPEFLVVALLLVPLAIAAMRRGRSRVLEATTTNANRRGDFLGVVSVQAGLTQTPVSSGLLQARSQAYKRSETDYLCSSQALADAYAWRTALIQALVLCVNICAVVLVFVSDAATSFVAPAVVIYFALTFSAGIQATIETIHAVGVVGLTVERVRVLADYSPAQSCPQPSQASRTELKQALAQGHVLIAVVGPSGVGKSVLVDSACAEAADGGASVVADVDPFAAESIESSGLRLAHRELASGEAGLIFLDETFKALSPEQERVELELAKAEAAEQGKQVVVVLHSQFNLDVFDAVVRLGE